MTHPAQLAPSRRRLGASSLAVIGLVVVLGSLAAALSVMSWGSWRERKDEVARTRVRYAAEGIVDEGLARLRAQGVDALRTTTGFPRTVADVGQTLAVTYGDTSATMADDLIKLVGVAQHDGVRSGVELFVRMTNTVDPYLLAFGDRSVTLGSNSSIDAYDSSLGTWASQVVGTRNSIPYASGQTSLGSNGSISVGGNGQVFGDARSGPGYSVSVSSNGYVRGTRSSSPAAVELPAVTVPVIPATGARVITTNPPVTIPPGQYHWTTFDLEGNANVTVQGPATLVLDNWFADSNARVTFDNSGGPIEVYVTNSLLFASNVIIRPTSGRPADLKIQASGVDKSIVMDSNVTFIGQLYAPKSNVRLLSNAHVYGSVVARTLDLTSNGFVSVDLDLLSSAANSSHEFTRVSWRAGPNLQ